VSKPSPSFSFLNSLLRDVSRSFYLTLRVLPKPVRWPIGLAYLLARASDTIADTNLLSVERRLKALVQLRERIMGTNLIPLEFGDLIQPQTVGSPRVVGQGTSAEWMLLGAIEDILSALNHFSEQDQQLIREVLHTIISGQELDLKRFCGEDNRSLQALITEAEVDDYTYRVAGCVGEFWTRMCQIHLLQRHSMDMDRLLRDGIRFGKGLQLVNILRDIPADLQNGRCYIPQTQLETIGLCPHDLKDPLNEPRFRPLYQDWLDRAETHLAAGWDYTNSLPFGCLRLRLACALPILIGIRTLAQLKTEPVLDPSRRVKVRRSDVRSILFSTILALPFPSRFRRLYQKMSQTTV
jgi:farnesyl-diphosphate farnesyltransferase